MQHGDIWRGLDLLAHEHGLTPSGLAKLAGLDATAFNKSKRTSKDGRPRWPSTESLSRALAAVGVQFEEFAAMVSGRRGLPVPVLGFERAASDGVFDEAGRPIQDAWDTLYVLGADPRDRVFALEIQTTAYEPIYNIGDRLILSRSHHLRKGQRVVVKTKTGSVMVKRLGRRSQKQVTLGSLNDEQAKAVLNWVDVDWVARILWVSQ